MSRFLIPFHHRTSILRIPPCSLRGCHPNQTRASGTTMKNSVGTVSIFCRRNETIRLLQRRWAQSEPKMQFQPTGLKVQPGKKDSDWDWFGTSAGRKGSFVSVTAIATGAMVLLWGPDTFGQDYVREVYQHFTNGFKTKVSQEMERLIQEVMSDASLSDEEIEKANVFVCSPLEAASWGFLDSRSHKVLIGYPHHLHYSSPSEVDLAKMRFGSRQGISSALKETEEAQKLQDSMCLSQEAKKFVIARELQYCRCGISRRSVAVQFAIYVVSAYAVSRYTNRRLLLFERHRAFRMLSYAAIGSILGLANLVAVDSIRCKVASECDEAACRLGPEYCRGGVEYYSKILQRHVALRTLLPNDEGKKLFNLKGDFYPGLVRTKVQPVSLRKETCSNVMNSTFGAS